MHLLFAGKSQILYIFIQAYLHRNVLFLYFSVIWVYTEVYSVPNKSHQLKSQIIHDSCVCLYYLKIEMCAPQAGNHFDQYEEGQLELEQASLDKPIEPVRLHLSLCTIGPAVRVDDWSRKELEPHLLLHFCCPSRTIQCCCFLFVFLKSFCHLTGRTH